MTGPFAPGLFAGRTALVTGGGTGIGFAIAEALGALGAAVIIAARTAERLTAASTRLIDRGIDCAWHQVNIRDEKEVVALFDKLAAGNRLPDILVNNAGGQFQAPALDISPNGFRAVVDLNLTGTWHMSQAFAKRRIAGPGGGRIVNIVLSIEGGSPGYAHAAAARAGVINLTKTLALEWAPYGITVNAVAPGTIRTSGLDQYDPATIEAGIQALPIKRMGEPQEVAHAVAFLASPAGEYVTGTTLFVDGGNHLARPLAKKD
ncbi:MAG: SDR family oxidoreductase [Rhodospirillales bacterium]|nr:SDR family oxidoreductase [Rhodospirillales bacterium]